VIRSYAIHIRSLSAAPKVAAADHDTYFYSRIMEFYNLRNDMLYGSGIDTYARFARQRFAADFQKYSLIHKVNPP